MSDALTIRPAREGDVPRLLEIYAPAILDSSASFELVVPPEEDFAERVRLSQEEWQWLVAERDEQLLGYAYGGSHRGRPAYRHSVEVSAYIAPEAQRQGIARRLYEALLSDLREMGYCNAFAGVTLPNEASVAFHESLGFRSVGVFHRIGWKFDRWHDVQWFERRLLDAPPAG